MSYVLSSRINARFVSCGRCMFNVQCMCSKCGIRVVIGTVLYSILLVLVS